MNDSGVRVLSLKLYAFAKPQVRSLHVRHLFGFDSSNRSYPHPRPIKSFISDMISRQIVHIRCRPARRWFCCARFAQGDTNAMRGLSQPAATHTGERCSPLRPPAGFMPLQIIAVYSDG